MPHVLFVVEKPEDKINGIAPTDWSRFEAALSHIDPPMKMNTKLAQTVWLLDLTTSLAALSELTVAAKTNHLTYKVSLFESDPIKIS